MIYNINNDTINKECLICLEINDNNSINKLIKLEKMNDYCKKCTCTALVHKKCLSDWYNFKNICPICRIKVYKKKTLREQITNKCKKIFSKRNMFIFYIIRFTYNILCIIFFIGFVIFVGEIYVRLNQDALNKSENENEKELADGYNQISPHDL